MPERIEYDWIEINQNVGDVNPDETSWDEVPLSEEEIDEMIPTEWEWETQTNEEEGWDTKETEKTEENKETEESETTETTESTEEVKEEVTDKDWENEDFDAMLNELLTDLDAWDKEEVKEEVKENTEKNLTSDTTEPKKDLNPDIMSDESSMLEKAQKVIAKLRLENANLKLFGGENIDNKELLVLNKLYKSAVNWNEDDAEKVLYVINNMYKELKWTDLETDNINEDIKTLDKVNSYNNETNPDLDIYKEDWNKIMQPIEMW